MATFSRMLVGADLPAGLVEQRSQGYMAQDRDRLEDRRLRFHDRAGRDGQQDYELWTVTFPYISAGDLLRLSTLNSRNMPGADRFMNWNDAKTDEYLEDGPCPR